MENVEYQPGQRVCMVGIGTDRLAHRHGTVKRLTATQIVVAADTGHEDRFRRNEIFHTQVPYIPYGGVSINPTCQRPRKVNGR
jgi:hypothetical protein